MTTKVEILGELILSLIKKKKTKLVEVLLERIKEEGNFFLFPHLYSYLIKRREEVMGFELGKLILAFDFEEKKIEKLISRYLEKKIKIEEKKIDKDLILGGKLIGKDFLVDFSFKNLLLKLIKKNG